MATLILPGAKQSATQRSQRCFLWLQLRTLGRRITWLRPRTLEGRMETGAAAARTRQALGKGRGRKIYDNSLLLGRDPGDTP